MTDREIAQSSVLAEMEIVTLRAELAEARGLLERARFYVPEELDLEFGAFLAGQEKP